MSLIKTRVLVGENNDFLGEIIEGLLNDKYEVKTFSLACDIPNYLLHCHADLIILDYNMPDIAGLELLKKIRLLGVMVPVVLLVGSGSYNVAKELFQLGGADILEMPNGIVEIEKIVHHLLIIEEEKRRYYLQGNSSMPRGVHLGRLLVEQYESRLQASVAIPVENQ